jgi:hypothetical protein
MGIDKLKNETFLKTIEYQAHPFHMVSPSP